MSAISQAGTARGAVRARKTGTRSVSGAAPTNESGGFTAGDAAAQRPYRIGNSVQLRPR